MPLTMKCACGKLLDVNDEQIGQPAECPWCGNRFRAGDAVGSSTALQAEEPAPKAVGRANEDPVGTLPTAPRIDIASPWTIPTFAWKLGFAALGFGALLAVRYYLLLDNSGYTLEDAAHTQVYVLTNACAFYNAKHGEFPRDLELLLVKDEKGRPYLESPDAVIDPWGGRYFYDAKGPRNNGLKPDIWTVSPKGIEIGNWPRGN